MSKQKEVPLATTATVTGEERIKNLKRLKNWPYTLKTSHFFQLFYLLPNSFGPYEFLQAAVLKPKSCLRSEERSQPFCMFVNSLSDLLKDQTHWVLAPFCPQPDTGHWKAVLSLRAEFGQFEVVFSNVSSHSGIRMGIPPEGQRGHASWWNITAKPESKTKKLPVTRKNRKQPTLQITCAYLLTEGESCNNVILLSQSKSVSLSHCVQHVDV